MPIPARHVTMQRPQRWDQPFDASMTPETVAHVLRCPPLDRIDPDRFPAAASLSDILLNDARLVHCRGGDIIVRQGDYGSSAFFILDGRVRVLVGGDLPPAALGRTAARRMGWFQALSQAWRNHQQPEVRETTTLKDRAGIGTRGSGDGGAVRMFFEDPAAIASQYSTVSLEAGDLFGEIAALARSPRTATVYADGKSRLLEVRWQGLRDIRRRAQWLHDHIDRLYRDRSLKVHLAETPLLRHLPEDELDRIAEQTLFESYGEFDWFGRYKSMVDADAAKRFDLEPVIAEEGHYVDGLIMIREGFARVSRRVNNGQRTLNTLKQGDTFGLEEITYNRQFGRRLPLQASLRAIGHVEVLRVPTTAVETHVLPHLPASCRLPPSADADSPPRLHRGLRLETRLLEFLVEYRFINGTAAMVIDLDRCVGCDDCVRACAAGHDNNPRFVRHGRSTDHFMVANACMHCIDPVCMIGCPTGAIHRNPDGGQVLINDATCIGCATCANSCPYDNIRMVEIRDRRGELILDEASHAPLLKATKCDLCIGQVVSPACSRACPHDAMVRIDMGEAEALERWFGR